MENKTVIVTYNNNCHTISMVWNSKVSPKDVKAAFAEIDSILNASESPLYVLVDISANPNFPIADTIAGVLFGPYRNKNLKGWLIIGKTSMAQMIERVLSSVTGIKNVFWFDTEEEALEYALSQRTYLTP